MAEVAGSVLCGEPEIFSPLSPTRGAALCPPSSWASCHETRCALAPCTARVVRDKTRAVHPRWRAAPPLAPPMLSPLHLASHPAPLRPPLRRRPDERPRLLPLRAATLDSRSA